MVATADSISAVISAAVSSGDCGVSRGAAATGDTTLTVTVSALQWCSHDASADASADGFAGDGADGDRGHRVGQLAPRAAMGLLGTCIAVLATAWV